MSPHRGERVLREGPTTDAGTGPLGDNARARWRAEATAGARRRGDVASVRRRRGPSTTARSPRESESRFSRRFLGVFFALYFVLGLGLIAVTPPFQSPDAFAHFDRAVAIAQGQLVSTTSAGSPGDVFPVGVYQTEVIFSGMAEAPAVRLTSSEYVYAWHQSWNSSKYFTIFDTGGNIPFLYAPQVMGVEIGRVVGGHVLVSYYLAEVMNLLAFVALTGWAMSQFPRRIAVAFAVFLTLPMVSSLAISVNPDCLLIALSAVFAAAWYRRLSVVAARRPATGAPGPARPWNVWATRDERLVYAALFFMAVEKPPLLLLALLSPLADEAVTLRRYALRVTVVAGSIAVAYELWARIASVAHVKTHLARGVVPVHQLQLMVTNPVKDVDVVITTLRQYGVLFAKEFIAGIGWLDTWFPRWFYQGMAVILVFAVAGAVTAPRWGSLRTAGASLVLALTAAALLFTFYLVDTPYFNPTVIGFQGRYLLPLVPSLLVTLGWRSPVNAPLHARGPVVEGYVTLALIALQVWVFTAYVVTVVHRYWP